MSGHIPPKEAPFTLRVGNVPGGDTEYTSIQVAINDAAPFASAANPWTILIYPGIYTEQITCASYVNLRGIGPNDSVIIQQVDADVITLANNVELEWFVARVTTPTLARTLIKDNGVACIASIKVVTLEITTPAALAHRLFNFTAASAISIIGCFWNIGGTGITVAINNETVAANILLLSNDGTLAINAYHIRSTIAGTWTGGGNRWSGTCGLFNVTLGTITLSGDQHVCSAVSIVAAAANVLMREGKTTYHVWPGMDIQHALTAGAGLEVVIHAGAYAPIANLTVSANTLVRGEGKATIITPTGAAITRGIDLNGDNITLRDMKVILAAGAGAVNTRPNVIYATGRTLLWLEDLWLVGDTTVLDDASDVRQNGVCFVTCTYCKVVNCQSQTNKRSGICLGTSSNYNTIAGNTCQGNTGSGIYNSTSNYNTITGNTCRGNTGSGIYLYISTNNTIAGNTCHFNTGSGIYLGTNSNYNTATGNTCPGNGNHNIYIFRSSYCVITSNSCNGSTGADGINVTGDGATNSDYNTITGNVCTLNASKGIEIVGGANANRNMLKGNNTYGNTSRGVVDAGTNTIFDQVMHSIALDLTGGATDIEAFFAKCPCILAGYSVMYSIATVAGAGVNIRVGRYQDGVALDDDYFDVSVSEINKNKGYSKHFVSADLTQTVIAAGDTITVGTAGGKADTGKVILILEIAEMSN